MVVLDQNGVLERAVLGSKNATSGWAQTTPATFCVNLNNVPQQHLITCICYGQVCVRIVASRLGVSMADWLVSEKIVDSTLIKV